MIEVKQGPFKIAKDKEKFKNISDKEIIMK